MLADSEALVDALILTHLFDANSGALVIWLLVQMLMLTQGTC